jgi:hypothetical protein
MVQLRDLVAAGDPYHWRNAAVIHVHEAMQATRREMHPFSFLASDARDGKLATSLNFRIEQDHDVLH